MDASLQFEIISETFIKPSSPTPPSLRYHKLSLFDQGISPYVLIRVAFFYPNIKGTRWLANEISQLLKSSLSKTLAQYYPFAGRLMKNGYMIDCNDMGAQFTEGRINCRVSEIRKQLSSSSEKMEDLIFARSLFSGPALANHHSLVFVQLSSFNCGGIVLSVSINHRIADASSVSTFMNDWAAIARQTSDIPSPHLHGASLFPPVDGQQFPKPSPPKLNQGKHVKRMLAFHASKIGELKAVALNSGVENPTRFEVVSALLYSCFISAASKANSGSHIRQSIFGHPVNFRQIIVPPLPQNSVGNFFTYFLTSVDNNAEVKLPELINKIREGKTKVCKECTENINAITSKLEASHSAPLTAAIETYNSDFYACSSWCRFPFYGVDFGWGTPSLVYPATTSGLNMLILIDMEDGNGIYAHVKLKDSELDVSVLEENDVLLAYASLDA
ncbi:deacetylvindoline O-acetyltransferase-like [Coffea eugenioides]|uniref:Diaboline synthase-like n=1 Tax=Coffea arabica TaxID=13443 RepID=A0A6P6VFJ3_COFAR|nr:deacetylvindoline O-acetyltransferase-like [Coffea eugenioides]